MVYLIEHINESIKITYITMIFFVLQHYIKLMNHSESMEIITHNTHYIYFNCALTISSYLTLISSCISYKLKKINGTLITILIIYINIVILDIVHNIILSNFSNYWIANFTKECSRTWDNLFVPKTFTRFKIRTNNVFYVMDLFSYV